MSDKCVYMVTVDGKDVPVEASNQAQAIRIATRPLVTGCRPLRGNEVLDLYRAGTKVLTADGAVGGEDEAEEGQQGEGELGGEQQQGGEPADPPQDPPARRPKRGEG